MGLLIGIALLFRTIAWAVHEYRKLRRALASRLVCQARPINSPIGLDELHAFRWELDHTGDLAGRLRAEGQL